MNRSVSVLLENIFFACFFKDINSFTASDINRASLIERKVSVYAYRQRERQRETERERQRQTDRQTDRQRKRQRQRQRQTDRQTEDR